MRFWCSGVAAGILAGCLVVAGLMSQSEPAGAQSDRISAFFGSYTGEVVFASAHGLEKRDLDVTIQKEGRGFSIAWTTVSQRARGKTKTKSHFVAFGPPDNTGIRLPAGSIDRFGAPVVLDPLKGRPLLSAEVRDVRLRISAVVQTGDGVQEKQIYDRMLVPGGLDLTFTRTRDGSPVKTLRVKMKTKNQSVNPR